VTTSIKSSLRNLHGALEKLEDTVVSVSAIKKKAQDDLFSIPMRPSANDMDSKAIASRLDSAIAKVEKLLREG